MPKDTFFNLAPEKKDVILAAALKEFSQHNVHESSVANIVRDSQIARGSFYKYFEDIDDLYFYLYHEVTKHAHGTVIEAIQQENGDLFAGLERYLDELITAFSNEKYHDYFKVVTLNLNYVTEMKLASKRKTQHQHATTAHDFTRLVKMEQLKVTTQEELLDFFKVLVPVIHECLSEYFAKDWSRDALFAQYHKRIKWLKYGILK